MIWKNRSILPSLTVDNPDVRFCPLILMLVAGCSAARQGVPPLAETGLSPAYRIGCPDVLSVSFATRPASEGLVSVDLDGRAPIPGVGRPRVEGFTAAEAAASIALMAEVPPESVGVAVLENRAATVFVHGPSNRRTAMLPYAGPEPVLDFLRRTGTIPAGASKLNRVYVLRSNVAAGTPPRLYHVDVEAVLLDSENATNLPLEPGDHVYIGETRRSSIVRLLPDWAKPLYRKVVGLLPDSWR
jgi:protein involved in polysaccharide export with SLBB domain